MTIPTLIGSTTPDSTGFINAEVIIWLVILLAVVVGGALLIVFVRRRMNPEDGAAPRFSFNLETLREMRDKGELTEEEFKKACDHLRRDAEGGGTE
ncbi:MAG: SHOCT domain-containing protein [Phycisphaerales bacterium]|nr:SHOCT domain-containing protein [Phycisphaerales bacterium]